MLPLSSRQALQAEQKAADAEAAAAASWRVNPRATLTAHPEVDDDDDDGDDEDDDEGDEAEDFAAAHLGFAHIMAGSFNCGPVRGGNGNGGTAITSYPPNN